MTIGDYKYLQRLAEERIQNAKLAEAEKDFQNAIVLHHYAEGQLHDQITGLNRVVAEREGQIGGLKEELGKREGQIAGLKEELGKQGRQIADLKLELSRLGGQIAEFNEELVERKDMVASIQSSFCWKVLTRIQKIRYARIVRNSGIFDRSFYLSQNPDVAEAGIDPITHYFIRGAYEGRDPNALFDSSYYLSKNPDVAKAGVNPLAHYLVRGASEGRDPHPLFSTRTYLSQNPDVVKAGVNPLLHYIRQLPVSRPGVSSSIVSHIPNPLDAPMTYAPPHVSEIILKDQKARMAPVFEKIQALNAEVSVIIPCFNYGKYVQEAVDSVLAQSYNNLEVIVVDDGSTDPYTLEVLPRLENDRVRILHQENQGLSMARNNGASVAKGNFLVFLDADDTLDEDSLALMLYQFVLNPEASAVFPQQHFFGDQNLVWACQEFNTYDLLWAAHVTVCIMIRRQVFMDSKKYQPSMKYGYEDWEFSLGLAGKGCQLRLLPLPIFNHRRHGRTMTAEAHDRKTYLYNELIRLNHHLYSVEELTRIKRKWRPLVSVIIPFYNSTTYIDETMASIKQQTIDDYEVILIDDGSDDPNAVHKLEEIEAEGFVRVIRMEHKGTAAARNRGALEACGEFLCFLDADDLIDPSYCEVLGIKLAMNPHLAFVYSGVVHFGNIQAVVFDEYDVERLKRENFLAVTSLIRRQVYLQIGGMDEMLIDCHEDYDFWLRLAELGFLGAMVHEPLFHYRRHAHGKMARVTQRMSDQEILALMRDRHPTIFGKSRDFQIEMKLLNPPTQQDEIITRTASYYRQVKLNENILYQGYRRANSPNLFQIRYHDPGKINILYLIPYMVIGGAERIDLDILAGLDRSQFRIILAVELQAENAWHEKFKALVDELFLCPNFTSSNQQLDAFLDYLLVAKNIDIVFNRNTYAGYRAFQRWKPIHPSVRFADLCHLHNFGEDWINHTSKIGDCIHRRYVTNHDLKKYMMDRYDTPSDLVRVIHCGVDTQRFNPDAIEPGRLRNEMQKKPAQKIVGFLGRFDDQKNPIKWLEVALEIHRADPNVFFAMIGGGSLLDRCVEWTRRHGLEDYVHFCGFRDNVANLLIDIDCLLLVSGYEGLPQVVFEAMSLGVPIVSSDAGGTRECITEDVGAILPINAPPGEFARRVLSILGSVQGSSLRQRCRDRIVNNFTVEKMQRSYVAEFKQMFAEIDRKNRLREHQINLMHKPIFF